MGKRSLLWGRPNKVGESNPWLTGALGHQREQDMQWPQWPYGRNGTGVFKAWREAWGGVAIPLGWGNTVGNEGPDLNFDSERCRRERGRGREREKNPATLLSGRQASPPPSQSQPWSKPQAALRTDIETAFIRWSWGRRRSIFAKSTAKIVHITRKKGSRFG